MENKTRFRKIERETKTAKWTEKSKERRKKKETKVWERKKKGF